MIKVIVVDDERFVRMGIVGETDWASLGCEVVGEAENGLDALELVQKKNPDLMICDIRMPKMNGLEMLILRAKERIETDRGKQRDTGLSRSVPDKAPVKEQYPGALEGDGPEINAAVIRLCLPFDENTAGLTGYIRDAVLYMASHYGESTINVAKIAGAVGISEGHLSHCFKKETGYTGMGWLTRYRMKKAVELLSDHRNKVYEVAEKVGYKDIAYFSNTFKKIAGVAPSEIQEK